VVFGGGWPYKRGTKSALIRGVAFGRGWLYKRLNSVIVLGNKIIFLNKEQLVNIIFHP
jgi:hypothetical protein